MTEASKPVRERAGWREGYLAAVVAGFVAFCMGPALVGAKTLLSVNLLSNFYPWISLHGDNLPGHESCTGDTVDAVMPQIAAARSALYSGHILDWQSVIGGGGPLLGVPDAGLLDPLSLPYFILPLWMAPAFVALLELLVGIGGTFLFLRLHRMSRPASMLAGLIFVTSGFMVMWSNWPQTRVAALIPAVFWSVERLIQRTRLRDTVLVAVVIASMLLGGFPQVTGFTLYLASGYLVVRVILLHRRALGQAVRTIALAAGGLVLGVLLAGVQMLPFLYFFTHSDLGYRTGDAKLGLPLSGLLTLFAPNSYGLCVFPQATRGTTNPVELVAYVGAGALILAIAGAAFGWRRRSTSGAGDDSAGTGLRGYFVAATVVIVALGWASPTARSIAAGLPVFADNFIGRIRSVLGFGLAVLAGIGFDWMTSVRTSGERSVNWVRALWAGAVMLLSAGTGLLVLRQAHRSAYSGGYWPALERALRVPALLLVVAVIVVALSRLRITGLQTAAFLILPVLVAAQGAQFFHTVLPGDSKANFYPDTPTHQYLAKHLGHDSFASSARTMYTATALYYGLRTPTGHLFITPTWQALLQKVDPHVLSTPTFSDFTAALNDTTIADQPILDRLGVKYFVLPPSEVAGVGQALPSLDGTEVAPSGEPACTIPGQPIRGVRFEVARSMTAANATRGITLDVTIRNGDTAVDSGIFLASSVAAGTTETVAVAGESLNAGDGPLTVSIRAVGATSALVLGSHQGQVACSAISPAPDGLRLVFADSGSVIYQRLTALPRIRWEPTATVIADQSARLAALEHGVAPQEVVLSAPGPLGSGQPATVQIGSDIGGHISAEVHADGGGYLVVADSMQQPGWSVTVDGKAAHLVDADEAIVAVYVPAGDHNVDFDYRTPGQAAGLVMSAVALLLIVVVLGWDRLVSIVGFDRRHGRHSSAGRRRRGRVRATDTGEGDT
jgi:hypothetical protein